MLNEQELNHKIADFLNRKLEKYPDLLYETDGQVVYKTRSKIAVTPSGNLVNTNRFVLVT